MELRDGTIIPSFLGAKDTTRNPQATEAFNNNALRIGEVLEIVRPTDSKSVSKKFNEYVVRVQHMSPSGAATSAIYPRCFLVSTFGGQADRLHYTLRTQRDEGSPAPSKTGLGLGSKVLVLCINGETNNAVIIGGIREGDNHDKNEGHHLRFNFNGINIAIKDTGELVIQMAGPTKADGRLVDSSSKTTTISLTKDGVVSIDCETGVHLGSTNANEALVKGTTYRRQERNMHQALMSDLVNLSTQFATLSGLIVGCGTILGSIAANPANALFTATNPGVAASLTAASVPLISSTSAFASISALFTKMYNDIVNFEIQAGDYLSKKNTTDG